MLPCKNEQQTYDLLNSIEKELRIAGVDNSENQAVSNLALIIGSKLNALNDNLDFTYNGKHVEKSQEVVLTAKNPIHHFQNHVFKFDPILLDSAVTLSLAEALRLSRILLQTHNEVDEVKRLSVALEYVSQYINFKTQENI